MPEIIDACSHILTEAFLERLEEVHRTVETENLWNAPRLFAVEDRIDYLDEHGIDRQVINLAAPMAWRGADPDEVLDVVRFANDEIRRIADEHPDRFVPTGTVPFLTGEYVDEFERCVGELDMAGVQILSNVEGRMLDDEAFYPFYEAVDDAGVPIWIHPQLHEWHDYDASDTWIYKMMGWPFDTSVAVARLVLNGVMDRFENLRIVTHHLGGAIPYWSERLESWVQSRTEEPEMYTEVDLAELSQPVEAYFDRVYADTAVSSQGEEHTLRCGLEFFGAENVLYGADYPFGPDEGRYWTPRTISAIEGLDVPDSTKRKIFAGNVERLLDL